MEQLDACELTQSAIFDLFYKSVEPINDQAELVKCILKYTRPSIKNFFTKDNFIDQASMQHVNNPTQIRFAHIPPSIVCIDKAEEIVSYMPQDIKTFYEPFLGSGAVLGTLCNYNNNSLFKRFEKAVGSDVLPFLIEIFQYVKNDPTTLIDHYRTSLEGYNDDREKKYLEIRDRFNTDFNGLDFAVLSRTGYGKGGRFGLLRPTLHT